MRKHLMALAALGVVAALTMARPPSVSGIEIDAPVAPDATSSLDVPPPGANEWACKPNRRHPQPVVLVNGTFESMAKNWPTMSPMLADRGYCVFAFNYGNFATGPVADSAKELKAFVGNVLRRTGARKVDLVGHSQGGMMPRYYLRFLDGADKVDDLIGLAPSNHGTQGVIAPPPDFAPPADWPDNPLCQACADQQAGSPLLRKLNRAGDAVAGPDYTVISTVYDEVVTPYRSQFLDGPRRRVTNIVLQNKCSADLIEHDQMPNDLVAQRLVLNALRLDGPAGKLFQPDCTPWRAD
jgi:triacylglycerol lipase